VQNTGLPADIADAVVHVESNYDPSTIGGVGEIGLMQIRPETAAMLGFRGSNDELARPEINIHYGVIYLSKAWRLPMAICAAP
jgi:soluble lytic murein transglycosylase-like protein